MIRVDCSKASTLREAVALCRDSLKSSGNNEYAALVEEQRIRSAILTAIASYRSQVEKSAQVYGEDFPWVQDEFVVKQAAHFEETVQPVLVRIAECGLWPKAASFFYFLTRTDDENVRHDCFSLRLELETPGSDFVSFSHPLIDLYFGRFSPSSDD